MSDSAQFMPSFNMGAKPAEKKETAGRQILGSIGNQDGSKKIKGKMEIKQTTIGLAAAPSISVLAPAMPKALKADVDARPMDIDLPRTSTWPALPPGVEDIDDEEADNPLLVAEYVNDIYAYMRDLEVPTPSRACADGFSGPSCRSGELYGLVAARDWNQREDARHPGGLAGGGPHALQASSGDSLHDY